MKLIVKGELNLKGTLPAVTSRVHIVTTGAESVYMR